MLLVFSVFLHCLTTVQNNTILKLRVLKEFIKRSLTTVQNNTILKQNSYLVNEFVGLTTVQNNTILKRSVLSQNDGGKFDYRSE